MTGNDATELGENVSFPIVDHENPVAFDANEQQVDDSHSEEEEIHDQQNDDDAAFASDDHEPEIQAHSPVSGGPATRTRRQMNMTNKFFPDATGGLWDVDDEGLFHEGSEAHVSENSGPIALLASCDPTSVKEALSGEDGSLWKQAMQVEYDALISQKTWDVVTRPPGRNIIKTKWVFRTKYKSDGSIDKRKARMVAKGFNQEEGIDYQDIFAPVVRYDTVRFLLSLAAAKKMTLKQVDVVGAFLYGDLEEVIHIEEPEGFETTRDGSKVCHLRKALFGLKQAPRQWNKKFHSFLESAGLKATDADPCLYANDEHSLFFALYEDDGLLVAKDEPLLSTVIRKMTREFKFTVRDVQFFVGIQVEKVADGIFIHQKAYSERILERFNMTDCRPVATPADVLKSVKTVVDDDMTAGEVVKFPYRELIGSVMFLSICTRPDISCAVSVLSQFLEEPQQCHVTAAKRILRYLKGTIGLGIKYSGSSPLVGFSDADYAGDEESRRSRTGIVFVFNNGPITWLSQKQSTVSTSTCEAELTAAFAATKEIVWLR